MNRILLTLFIIPFFISHAQESYLEGTIFFYYNSHPSQLTSNDLFFSLDSVRFVSLDEKYPVWADFAQEEHFTQDTSLIKIANGKHFKIWDSIIQFSSTPKRNNYYHSGGDMYSDGKNDIVIAFYVCGLAYIVNPKHLKSSYSCDMLRNRTFEYLSDTIEVAQTVWYDYSTFNSGKYIIFFKIPKTKSLRRRQCARFHLKRLNICKFNLYGS